MRRFTRNNRSKRSTLSTRSFSKSLDGVQCVDSAQVRVRTHPKFSCSLDGWVDFGTRRYSRIPIPSPPSTDKNPRNPYTCSGEFPPRQFLRIPLHEVRFSCRTFRVTGPLKPRLVSSDNTGSDVPSSLPLPHTLYFDHSSLLGFLPSPTSVPQDPNHCFSHSPHQGPRLTDTCRNRDQS